jgi:3-hydroxyisobutyrate dehydrogenase-like beta-hydroxyacid dehydrogenase
MRVGFIGLGNIGGGMAANLAADGHDVIVFDSDPARVQALVAAGARAGSGAAEIGRECEITLLSLPTPDVVERVVAEWLTGAGHGSGKIAVDLSTNAPARVRALGERLARAGCQLVECPLTGGAIGAKSRGLVFMLGGEDAAVARVRPVLEKLGRAIFHLGPLGRGNTAKLVNSLLAFTSTWVTLEGLALAARGGVDLRSMVEVVRTAGAGNFFVDRAVEGINERGRPAQFALELAAKDAGLIRDLAGESGVPAPVAGAIAGVLRAAVAQGLGHRDWSDLVEHLEQTAGLRLVLPPKRD